MGTTNSTPSIKEPKNSIQSKPTSKTPQNSKFINYPPTPPRSSDNSSSGSSFGAEDNGEDLEDGDFDIPLPRPDYEDPTKVLDIDLKTPDFHVPRDPRLVRLTGVHPFNVESPLTTLFDQGFLTPPSLFYVRNHGAVPEVHDHEILDWDIEISGLVDNPITLSFSQILSEFEQVTLPITMVCAGNRRKEQNQIRKSQGFSWGAAGVSTALFTGPMLADVVRRARPHRGAKYLWMEGADDLPNGKYGTSVKLGWVMNRDRGIMMAHKMNGAPLTPDHGRPIRVVVPGQIGGRSVKWLKRIVIADRPSDNWYHKYDNRVLPTMVTPEMSKEDDDWWKDERYAIYDLSVNSAIAYPQHDEVLPLPAAEEESYNLRGYAYTGGLRKIARVELSLDKGRTWRLAPIEYPEDKYRSASVDGRMLFGGVVDMADRDTASYCWCFWNLHMPVSELAAAEDVVVRAMDDSMTIQPRDSYWSVLGMMHNNWFRIAIHRESKTLRFEHPTQPALIPGGWMERVKKAGGDFANGNWGERIAGVIEEVEEPEPAKEVVMINPKIARVIEIDELRKHDTPAEPWFVVNGEVYDGTSFLDGHPGGATSIVSAGGLDATDEFMAIHSESAKAMMPKYHIGSLSEASRLALAQPAAIDADAPKSDVYLNPRAWADSTLVSRKTISADTRIYTFTLPEHIRTVGLPVGQHLLLKLPGTTPLVRPYTPVSRNESNTIDLLVKIYFATPTSPGGKMTVALDALPLNSSVQFKGPLGKLEYFGCGRVSISSIERTVTRFVMICGGSGITPIFQVLRAVMEDELDQTRCIVLDGNRGVGDILCRDELDVFVAADGGKRLEMVHTLSKPDKAWTGKKGRIDKDMIKQYAGARGDREGEDRDEGGRGTLFLICGPEQLEKSVHAALKGLGWGDGDMVFF